MGNIKGGAAIHRKPPTATVQDRKIRHGLMPEPAKDVRSKSGVEGASGMPQQSSSTSGEPDRLDAT